MTRPHPARSWAPRLLMTAVFCANGLAFGTWAANIPRLRDAAGLGDAQLGLLLLCVSLGAVLAMPLVGAYGDRLGTARSCAFSGAVLAVATALPPLAIPFGPLPLAASAVLLGLSLGGLDVSMNAHAAAFERGWGAPIMSSLHAGWSGGELLGAALAGLLAGVSLPVAAATAAPLILLCAVCALRVPAPALPAAPDTPRFALPSRAMVGLCALAGLSFSIEGAVADWSGVYLRTVLGVAPALASSSLATFAAVMVGCRVVGDLAVRRLGGPAVIRLGGVLAAAGLAGAVLSTGVVSAGLAFALVGVGVANIVPVLFSAAGGRGAAGVAMVATVGYGAVMGAPPLMGFVAGALGLRTALLMAACAGLLVAVLARAARR